MIFSTTPKIILLTFILAFCVYTAQSQYVQLYPTSIVWSGDVKDYMNIFSSDSTTILTLREFAAGKLNMNVEKVYLTYDHRKTNDCELVKDFDRNGLSGFYRIFSIYIE